MSLGFCKILITKFLHSWRSALTVGCISDWLVSNCTEWDATWSCSLSCHVPRWIRFNRIEVQGDVAGICWPFIWSFSVGGFFSEWIAALFLDVPELTGFEPMWHEPPSWSKSSPLKVPICESWHSNGARVEYDLVGEADRTPLLIGSGFLPSLPSMEEVFGSKCWACMVWIDPDIQHPWNYRARTCAQVGRDSPKHQYCHLLSKLRWGWVVWIHPLRSLISGCDRFWLALCLIGGWGSSFSGSTWGQMLFSSCILSKTSSCSLMTESCKDTDNECPFQSCKYISIRVRAIKGLAMTNELMHHDLQGIQWKFRATVDDRAT